MQEPTPKQFGLTTDVVTRWTQWETDTLPRWSMYFWGGVILLAFLAGYREGGLVGAILFVIAFGVAFGLWGSLFFSIAAEYVARAIFPEAAAVARFRKAREEYDRFQRETEALYWSLLSGNQFEHALGAVLRHVGYGARVTPQSGDQGVDILITKDGRRGIVQCKATRAPVGPAIVRELLGALVVSGADYAVLASTGGVTQGVRAFTVGKPIVTLGIDDFIAMRRGEDALERQHRMQASSVTH